LADLTTEGVMGLRHTWTEEEMDELVDICLTHPPGHQRDRAGQALVANINAKGTNPIGPSAIGQALKATAKAIDGDYDGKPKASQAQIRIIERRREGGQLKRRW
jgi:hypothetical protein